MTGDAVVYSQVGTVRTDFAGRDLPVVDQPDCGLGLMASDGFRAGYEIRGCFARDHYGQGRHIPLYPGIVGGWILVQAFPWSCRLLVLFW